MRQQCVYVVTIVFVLAGCGSEAADDPGPATTQAPQQAETTAPPPTTTTTAAQTTTSAAPTTTQAAGCPDAEGLDTIETLETYSMDVDSDGQDDTVTTYFDETEGPHFGVLVEYASGGSARHDRPVFAVRQPLIPLGLHDIEGDGTMEMFVVEYAREQGISYGPDSFTKVIFLDAAECELTAISGGSNVAFGGTAAQLGNYPSQGIQLKCEQDRAVLYDFYSETQSGDAFRVNVSELRPSGASGQFEILETIEVPQDEMLARPLLDCGDLEMPGEIPPAP